MARISDCIMSLIRCDALMAPSTRKATLGRPDGRGRAAEGIDMREAFSTADERGS